MSVPSSVSAPSSSSSVSAPSSSIVNPIHKVIDTAELTIANGYYDTVIYTVTCLFVRKSIWLAAIKTMLRVKISNNLTSEFTAQVVLLEKNIMLLGQTYYAETVDQLMLQYTIAPTEEARATIVDSSEVLLSEMREHNKTNTRAYSNNARIAMRAFIAATHGARLIYQQQYAAKMKQWRETLYSKYSTNQTAEEGW